MSPGAIEITIVKDESNHNGGETMVSWAFRTVASGHPYAAVITVSFSSRLHGRSYAGFRETRPFGFTRVAISYYQDVKSA